MRRNKHLHGARFVPRSGLLAQTEAAPVESGCALP
jgi:hypothetical protein